jgi:hypothetical protein
LSFAKKESCFVAVVKKKLLIIMILLLLLLSLLFKVKNGTLFKVKNVFLLILKNILDLSQFQISWRPSNITGSDKERRFGHG